MENIYYKEEWPEDCIVIEFKKNPSIYQGLFSGNVVDNSYDLEQCMQDVQDCIDKN